jgi:glycerol-3-phosphate O-acyltransferase
MQHPDPEDQLAISKIAFQVAVEANRVTPATFPAGRLYALLGRLSRGP